MKKVIKIIILSIAITFLIIGIPIIINECYKMNCGYVTLWSCADLLGYYGTILGSIIAVTTLAITIMFTKKQIRRESFLQRENEKYSRLRKVFIEAVNKINPIDILENTMDNGLINPSKAINILQKYQMKCKTVNDELAINISMSDYPKFENVIKEQADLSEEFVDLSQKLVEIYSDFVIFKSKDSLTGINEIEKEHPRTFSKEDIESNIELLEKIKNIDLDTINIRIKKANAELIKCYQEKYILLLKHIGCTFEIIENEIVDKANNLLNIKNK